MILDLQLEPTEKKKKGTKIYINIFKSVIVIVF